MAKTTAKKRLERYRAKRDFKISPEPSGKEAHRKRTPRRPIFCVQKHLATTLHYDFRLEYEGVLLSWAVPKGPSLNPAQKRLAMHVEDHPLDYGDFEGVIPDGYGAGIVMLWDKGTWIPEVEDVAKALEEGTLKFSLDGVKLKGSWVLVRRGGDERSWLLIKHRDDWAGEIDVAEEAPVSVKTFGGFADILASEEPAVWRSHLAQRSGASGELLQRIIDQAAEIVVQRERSRGRRRTTR